MVTAVYYDRNENYVYSRGASRVPEEYFLPSFLPSFLPLALRKLSEAFELSL